MTPAARPPQCPRCGAVRVDEYTHFECPADAPPDHQHWVCVACDHEWILVAP
jgi:hypothetical protein